eukprot:g8344.t1
MTSRRGHDVVVPEEWLFDLRKEMMNTYATDADAGRPAPVPDEDASYVIESRRTFEDAALFHESGSGQNKGEAVCYKIRMFPNARLCDITFSAQAATKKILNCETCLQWFEFLASASAAGGGVGAVPVPNSGDVDKDNFGFYDSPKMSSCGSPARTTASTAASSTGGKAHVLRGSSTAIDSNSPTADSSSSCPRESPTDDSACGVVRVGTGQVEPPGLVLEQQQQVVRSAAADQLLLHFQKRWRQHGAPAGASDRSCGIFPAPTCISEQSCNSEGGELVQLILAAELFKCNDFLQLLLKYLLTSGVLIAAAGLRDNMLLVTQTLFLGCYLRNEDLRREAYWLLRSCNRPQLQQRATNLNDACNKETDACNLVLSGPVEPASTDISLANGFLHRFADFNLLLARSYDDFRRIEDADKSPFVLAQENRYELCKIVVLRDGKDVFPQIFELRRDHDDRLLLQAIKDGDDAPVRVYKAREEGSSRTSETGEIERAQVGVLARDEKDKEQDLQRWWDDYNCNSQPETQDSRAEMEKKQKQKSAGERSQMEKWQVRDFAQHHVGTITPSFWGTQFQDKDAESASLRLMLTFEVNIQGSVPRKITCNFQHATSAEPEEESSIPPRRTTTTASYTNVEPRWNAKQNSYVLPFYGRVKASSAKNFQLVEPQRPDEIMLLFGKIKRELFALDWRPPLSALDAFGIALASIARKRAVN